MRDSEAVVTPFMQVATYATRNFAHTIPIFRSGMDFLFIQFAHMPYNLSSLCLCIALIAPNAQSTLDTQRKVSEDPKNFGFLRIIQSLAYFRIQVSRFPHISQRFWFPADCPISCIFTVYKYQKLIQCTLSLCRIRIYPKDFGFLRIVQSRFAHISQRFWFPTDYPISCILLHTSIKVSAYMFALCNHVYCIQVSRALRSFPHIVGLHSFLTKKGGSIYLRTVKVTAAV